MPGDYLSLISRLAAPGPGEVVRFGDTAPPPVLELGGGAADVLSGVLHLGGGDNPLGGLVHLGDTQAPGLLHIGTPFSANALEERKKALEKKPPQASGQAAFTPQMQNLAPVAQQVEAQTGVPAPVMLAIATNETGGGTAPQGGQAWNSYFGIRGVGPAGQTPGGFRAYQSPEQSFQDFAALVTQDPRYAQAWANYQQTGDQAQLIADIGRAGYASAAIREANGRTEQDNWITQVQGLLPAMRGQGAVQGAGQNPLPQSGGFRITFGWNQPYGSAQFNPSVPQHRGLDLVPAGGWNLRTPVAAVYGGTVYALTDEPNGGHGVIIRHPDGLYGAYFHLGSREVQVGQQVQPGQIIAHGGGNSDHLHLEVRREPNQGDPVGSLIDPWAYFGIGKAP